MKNELLLLKEKLNELGITVFGVIDPNDYIAPHYYESMKEYYSTNQTNNTFSMDKYKSIIVIALNYKPSKYPISMSTGSCEIDYHKVFHKKVGDLSLIYDLGNFDAYIDTGPLFDRSLGLEAGLGFIGKNQCLINPEYGSFLYIGYILTDKYIERTEKKYENMCKSCNLCIKACPTKALSDKAYRPEICLAHLTQTKNPDENYLKYIKTFYGCDICQKVCPFNSYNKVGLDEFNTACEMTYEDLFAISNREYCEKYADKTFFWKKRMIIKRNAIIRAKNIKDFSIMPYLVEEDKKDNTALSKYILEFFRLM